MKRGSSSFVSLRGFVTGPMSGWCADQGFSLGYGMAAFNKDRSFGKLEGDKPYNFIQATYIYEKPLSAKELAFLIEPFAAYVAQTYRWGRCGPRPGTQILSLQHGPTGLLRDRRPGMAYTSVGFQEQGTHLLFILQGGVGYRYKSFFVEDSVRHYSNGGTAAPNWSVNSNILSVGTLW